ncbi:MAG: hypothetical protein JO110_04990 [Acetobacteraceae bacterium]|nr:hypothetical protein [Acetobacteraceae bacterium]
MQPAGPVPAGPAAAASDAELVTLTSPLERSTRILAGLCLDPISPSPCALPRAEAISTPSGNELPVSTGGPTVFVYAALDPSCGSMLFA